MPVELPLTEIESSWKMQRTPAITTITYYKGDPLLAAENLKTRLRKILLSNMWLAGKLEEKNKQLFLTYPDNPEEINDTLLDSLFHFNTENLKLDSETSYTHLVKSLAPAIVETANKLANTEKHICKFTLYSDATLPSERFLLVFSFSHNIGDGYSYYRILNMLSQSEEICSLNPARKEHFSPIMEEAMGISQWKWFMSSTHAFNMLRGIIFGKKARAFAYYIDSAKVDQIKHSEKQKKHSEYISTNDIITSSFSLFIHARISMMNINLRNRLNDIKDSFAGNYSGILLFDATKYNKPSSIRKVIDKGAPYIGTDFPLPRGLKGITCNLGLITNWAGFSKEIAIEGCQEVLHLPLYDLKFLPYEAAVIFRINKDRQGVIFMSRKFSSADFAKGLLPVTTTISDKIFPG